MKCSKCGTEVRDGARYCSECGHELEDSHKERTYEQTIIEEDVFGGLGNSDSCNSANNTRKTYCHNCGKPIEPGFTFCRYCGVNANKDDDGRPQKVEFVEAYKRYWKNYAKFTGRASISEFWYVMLWDIIISFALSVLETVSGADYYLYDETLEASTIGPFAIVVYIVISLWGIANIVPTFAIICRRLHDTGKSGWWIFISLVPVVGWILLIIFLASPSQQARNRFDN